MPKKKKQKTYRAPTRRQLSHWEKEKRRARIIFITGVFIIAAVILSILGGWIATRYLPMHEIIVKVNDRAFNAGYFIDMLTLSGQGNSSANIDSMTRTIEQNELIRQDCASLGITVSAGEINKELEKRNPPLSKKYADIMEVELLISKMRDDYFDKQVPVSAAQRHVMAMVMESEKQAIDITKKLGNGESFEKLAEEFSAEEFTKSQKGDLGWRPAGILSSATGSIKLEQYAFSADAGYLSDPIYDDVISKQVGYWILQVLERKEETKEAHLLGILLGSEDDAQKVKARLDAGEDFATLAKELSQHPDSKDAGGEMGWVLTESLSKPVAEYAFNTTIALKKLSDPVKDTAVYTKGGYWLIKVAEISADRPLDDENRNYFKSQLLNDWVDGLWTDPNYPIKEFLTPENTSFILLEASKIAAKKPGTQR